MTVVQGCQVCGRAGGEWGVMGVLFTGGGIMGSVVEGAALSASIVLLCLHRH